MNYYCRQYRTTQVATASKKRLVVYLYDAALHHVREAAEDMKAGRHSACGKHLGTALDIVIELACALDHQASDQLARRLEAVYNFLIESLAVAQSKNDVRLLRACEGILSTLGNAWRHVAQNGSAGLSRKQLSEQAREKVALAI
jgi:flagellar protein FliS